jgi:hypothetical protein
MAKNDNEVQQTLKVTISQAIRMVTACIKAKRVAMIHGSPAI